MINRLLTRAARLEANHIKRPTARVGLRRPFCQRYNWLMASIAIIPPAAALWLVFMAVPPLTESEQVQLATARDFGPLVDEGGLYPLLHNALQWPADHDQAGAVVPDYDSLKRQPADHRGQLQLIEGKLLRSLDPGSFARPGLWEDRWRQWAVQYGPGADQVAVVYLVDPPPARAGRQVRLTARFFKVWRQKDQRGEATDFLVFVGRGATVATGQPSGAWSQTVMMAVVLGTLGVIFIALRVRIGTMRNVRRPRPRFGDGSAKDDEQEESEELSDDPADALDVLERRPGG